VWMFSGVGQRGVWGPILDVFRSGIGANCEGDLPTFIGSH